MIISYLVDSQEFQKYEDKFSSFRFCGKFSEFFFFFYRILISIFIGTYGATCKKNTYIQPKKLDYDDSFGADISSICTASIFIRINFFSLFVYVRIISIPLIRLYIQISKYISVRQKYSFDYLTSSSHFEKTYFILATRICMNFFRQNIRARYSCSSFRLNKFVYLLFFLFFTFKSLLMRFLYRMHQ